MAAQETVPVGKPAPKNSASSLFQRYGMGIFTGVTMLALGFGLRHCDCLGIVRGQISQERIRRKGLKQKHIKEQEEKQKQLEYITIAINEHTSSVNDSVHTSHEKIQSEMNSLHCQMEEVQDYLKSILADLRIRIPNSDKADVVERKIRDQQFGRKKKRTDHIDVFKGSRILQLRVGLDDGVVDDVRDLADALTEIEEEVTVQLDDFLVCIRTEDGMETMRLNESHKVPVILHASYAAGQLTVEGFNLKDATIKAATSNESLILKNVEDPEVIDELEVCTWFVQLPSCNFEEVGVYALKTIHIEEQEVTVYSSVIKIQDNNLRTVVRIGIPWMLGMISNAGQLFRGGVQVMKWSSLAQPYLAWVVLFVALILWQFLPPNTESMISEKVARVRFIVWSLYCSTRNFLFKQYPRGHIRGWERSLNGELEQSIGNLDGRADYPTELNVARLTSLTKTICQLEKTLFEMKTRMQEEDDANWYQEYQENQENNNLQSTTRGTTSADGNSKPANFSPIINPDWQWQVYQEFTSKSGSVRLKKCGKVMKENLSAKVIPFDVIYGLKEKLWAERNYVKIFSPSLIDIIVPLTPKYAYELSGGSLVVYTSALFHIREKLKEIKLEVQQGGALPEIAGPSSEESGENQRLIHLDHLLRFMEKELEDVLKKYSVMKRERHVSWDMLWAFFPSGTRVVYRCDITDDEVVGIATKASYDADPQGPRFLKIWIETWDYDCNTWSSYMTSRRVVQFDGESAFTELKTMPLRFKTDLEMAEKEFLVRGESFCSLSMQVRNRFMNYKGLIYMMDMVNGCPSLQKEVASGRVMVDLASFQKMNPSYGMRSAEPPCEVLRDNKVALIDITTYPTRMYAPAMVYGFSFRLKKWGTFRVCGFNDIDFNDSAYDALVMPAQEKELLYKIVREYMPRNPGTSSQKVDLVEQVDPIVSKGEGCIVLCYGGPGNGKRLTVESISETLHAPLLSLSVFELGITPQQLESYMVKVLDVAFTWGAILLLDDVDVYLEKQSSFDLTRTALTGIFLRNLEYYRGVLFLTTNRVVAIDESFRSRISMFLNYEPADRRKIWESVLRRVNMNDIPEGSLAAWSKREISGREIRNVVHQAMILAKGNGQTLSAGHIDLSLDALDDSHKVLAHNSKATDL